MTTAQSAQPGFAQRTLLPAPPGHGFPITQLNEQDPPGSLTQPRPPQSAQEDKISPFPPQQTTFPPHQRPQKLILSPVSSHPIHPEGPWGPPSSTQTGPCRQCRPLHVFAAHHRAATLHHPPPRSARPPREHPRTGGRLCTASRRRAAPGPQRSPSFLALGAMLAGRERKGAARPAAHGLIAPNLARLPFATATLAAPRDTPGMVVLVGCLLCACANAYPRRGASWEL